MISRPSDAQASDATDLYVEKGYGGPQYGTLANPYATVTMAADAAFGTPANLRIENGDYDEQLTISKPLTLLNYGNGTVIIGQPAPPHVWISSNEIMASEGLLAPGHFQSAYGWQFEVENSKDLSLAILTGMANSTMSHRVITEDGALNTGWLPWAMTPSVALTDQAGNAVSIFSTNEGTVPNTPVVTQPYTLPALEQTLQFVTGSPEVAGSLQPPLVTLLNTVGKTYFKNPGDYWMATVGSGSIYSAWVNPIGTPEQYQVMDLDADGSTIRPYDHIALQAANDYYVTSSGSSSGGPLMATSRSIGANERFRVDYLSSYVVATQVMAAPEPLVYTELNDLVKRNPNLNGAAPRDWTLSPDAIRYCAAHMGRAGGVLVLARSFTELSEDPAPPGQSPDGYLPGHADQIRAALACPQCGGAVWELFAGNSDTGQPLSDETLNGIAYTASTGKECFVMLAPHNAGNVGSAGSYVKDVEISINSLRNSPITAAAYRAGQIQIVLAAYERSTTGVHFIGTDGNAIEAALNWIVKYG